MSNVRTRIPPSPTGDPHIGTAYIALHNIALAKSLGGKCVLRIEDTDRVRSNDRSEAQIMQALRWLGLEWDEGPDIGGDHGPYRQSERSEIYQKHAAELVEKGKAYPCFCTKERLDQVRAEQMANKATLGYDGHCRDIDPGEAKSRIEKGEAHVIRLKVPNEGQTSFYDKLRKQEITIDNKEVDDQVLMKADGFPTYHLANVVDDHLMKITHVMRGEEWISSTPKHVLLYQSFGWEMPTFMHLSLLRNPDKSKISKRKNPTSLLWFQAMGYRKEAIVNFLALMGYSRADGNEFFSFEQLCQDYDLARLSSTSPVFDFAKLESFHTHYTVEGDDASFREAQNDATNALLDFVAPLMPHIKKRSKSRSDLQHWTDFLFERDFAYDRDEFKIKKLDLAQAPKALRDLAKVLSKTSPKSEEEYRDTLDQHVENSGLDKSGLYMLVRVAVMKKQRSLPLLEVLAFCSTDLNVKRLKEAAKFLQSQA